MADHIELIVRGVLQRGSRVLLCRAKGGYEYLPGGHIDFGEPAAAALLREFEEETGLRVRVGPLLLVTEDRFRTRKREHHEINLLFHVEHVPAPDSPDLEAVESREPDISFCWTELAAIVERDLRPQTIKAWLLARTSEPEDGRAEWASGFDATQDAAE